MLGIYQFVFNEKDLIISPKSDGEFVISIEYKKDLRESPVINEDYHLSFPGIISKEFKDPASQKLGIIVFSYRSGHGITFSKFIINRSCSFLMDLKDLYDRSNDDPALSEIFSSISLLHTLYDSKEQAISHFINNLNRLFAELSKYNYLAIVTKIDQSDIGIGHTEII